MDVYFDCFAGISGDMTLGALIDLGVDTDWLKDALCSIPLTGFDIKVSDTKRMGIGAKDVIVHAEETGHARDYAAIKILIQKSPLSVFVRELSLEIFKKIAYAEARIHRQPVDKVHFHEVGGIDAIVDIVGTCLCIECLDIKKIITSKIPLGKGFVTCRHGTLPLPAPATVEILKNVPVYGSQISSELVTPTGAAIIATISDAFDSIPDMIIKKTGYGAGKKIIDKIPNLLRVIAGEIKKNEANEENRSADYVDGLNKDTVVIVEASIDDMNPEIFGFLMDRLFEDGALDVLFIPVYMKKNRPGTVVQVLCHTDKQKTVVKRLIQETTTLGVRYYETARFLLDREKIEIDTPYGKLLAKKVKYPDMGFRIIPEYESCKKAALLHNVPVNIVYDSVK